MTTFYQWFCNWVDSFIKKNYEDLIAAHKEFKRKSRGKRK